MHLDVLVASNDKNLPNRLMKAENAKGIKIKSIHKPVELRKYVKRKGKLLEVILLDLTFPDGDLIKFIFHIRNLDKDIPVMAISAEKNMDKNMWAAQNLTIKGFVNKPSNIKEAKEIIKELNRMFDLDMDKQFEKVEYLKKEGAISCTFKNLETFFLKKEDIPGDKKEAIKNISLDPDDPYHFSIHYTSKRVEIIPWSLIRHLYDKDYTYFKENSEAQDSITQKKVGARLARLRRHLKLKQEDLAKATGIKRANISRIESGKHRPSLATLERLAEALKVSVSALVS